MSKFMEALRKEVPTPILSDSDLLFAGQSITVAELKAFCDAQTYPAWTTQPLHGSLVFLDGIDVDTTGLPFIEWGAQESYNSGYFSMSNRTAMVVPAGVTKCLATCTIRCTGTAASLSLYHNGVEVLQVKGSETLHFNIPVLEVVAGDTLQIKPDAVGTLLAANDLCLFAVKTLEKLT